MKYFLSAARLVTILLLFQNANAQFTRQDSLRGTLTPARSWWNVTRYDLTVEPDYETKTIKGLNIIHFDAVENGHVMQIDLQSPMNIDSVYVISNKKRTAVKYADIRAEFNVHFIPVPAFKKGTSGSIEISFHGKPRIASNPPWDGGWIWKKDAKGRPWMSVACQGLGASVWFPCKDHQSDEPEKGASLGIIVPDSLQAIGNGRLAFKRSAGNGKSLWSWEVKNPINSYNIIPYIGKYRTWAQNFSGEKGKLTGQFWVLEYNEEKAKKQFGRDVPKTLQCFEEWFGPYPFYEDGFKLVESPHLGMEHQSAVAYGNHYMDGYLGMDLSGTGWGKKFDYIIVHETGHEWFGNNITTADIADMWVHEGFTSYSEVVFVECHFGRDAAFEYARGLRNNIGNKEPVIGSYGVNKEGSGDMYAKGANMIHTIRQIINDDNKFKSILRGLNKDFYHSIVTSADVEKYIAEKSGKKLDKIFDQYLRASNLPVLEYKVDGKKIMCRWNKTIAGFDMPLRLADSDQWIYPTTEWQSFSVPESSLTEFKIDKNFYILKKDVSKE